MITVSVKHGPTTHEVQVEPGAKAQVLYEALEKLTNVFVRNQKLICKGKVLVAEKPLSGQGVADGAKLMLMAGGGGQPTKVRRQLHASLHGDS